MDIQLGYYPQVLILVLTRVAAVTGFVPFYGGPRVPINVRMAFAFLFTLVILPLVPEEWARLAMQLNTLPALLLAMCGEVLLGVGIGLVCHSFIGGCLLGGMIVGRSSSLMMARTIDPVGGSQNTITAQVLQMVFILIVLALNGHILLLRFLAFSFETISQPMGWMDEGFFAYVIELGRRMFELGLKLALPVLCAGMIINVCLALMARLAPDFNVLFLSLPIRLLVGISVFGLALRFSAGLFGRMTEEMLSGCGRLLGG